MAVEFCKLGLTSNVLCFRFIALPVLVPLTVDRSVAILNPVKYKMTMTHGRCRAMILLSWIPLLVPLIHDCSAYGMGILKVISTSIIVVVYSSSKESESSPIGLEK